MVFHFLRPTMPLYEYKCSKCEAVFEVLQKVNAPPLKTCIRCEGAVERVLSPPTLQFKGSGWYVTDYASKGKQASNSEDKATRKKGKDTSEDKKSSSPSSSEKK
jgi:putative FmdB family regulatory protein